MVDSPTAGMPEGRNASPCPVPAESELVVYPLVCFHLLRADPARLKHAGRGFVT